MEELSKSLMSSISSWKESGKNWAQSTGFFGGPGGPGSNPAAANHPSQFLIQGRRYAVVRLIAQGGYSFVFLVKDENGKEYALKRMIVDERELKKVQKEVSVMKELQHENIVKLEKAVSSKSATGQMEIYLVLEYLSGGSLYDLLNQRHPQPFSEKELLQIFLQICRGIQHLHCRPTPIAHRDIKVENVLYDGFGTFKVCDFGSATKGVYRPVNERERNIAEDDINANTTLLYRAPEMLDLYGENILINEKVDIWALGCLLYNTAFFVHPFDQKLGILNCKYDIPAGHPYSPNFINLIRSMLIVNPEERPNIVDILIRVSDMLGLESSGLRKQQAKNTLQVTNQEAPGRKSSESNRPRQGSASAGKTSSGSKEVFNMLDWYDNDGTGPSPQPSANNLSGNITNSAPHNNNDDLPQPDFADFSQFNSNSNTQRNYGPGSLLNPAANMNAPRSPAKRNQDPLDIYRNTSPASPSPRMPNKRAGQANDKLTSVLDWIPNADHPSSQGSQQSSQNQHTQNPPLLLPSSPVNARIQPAPQDWISFLSEPSTAATAKADTTDLITFSSHSSNSLTDLFGNPPSASTSSHTTNDLLGFNDHHIGSPPPHHRVHESASRVDEILLSPMYNPQQQQQPVRSFNDHRPLTHSSPGTLSHLNPNHPAHSSPLSSSDPYKIQPHTHHHSHSMGSFPSSPTHPQHYQSAPYPNHALFSASSHSTPAFHAPQQASSGSTNAYPTLLDELGLLSIQPKPTQKPQSGTLDLF